MKLLFSALWKGWKALARRIGEFQSTVLLTVLYVILVGPLAVLLRLFSDPLQLKRPSEDSYWLARRGTLSSLEEARDQ